MLQQIAQAADVIVQLGALGLHGARRNLIVDPHGELIHRDLERDLLGQHAIGGVSFGPGDGMVVVEGRRGNDLVGRIRSSVPPDIVHRGSGLVFENLHQIAVERRRIEGLFLIEMSAEYQMMVRRTSRSAA